MPIDDLLVLLFALAGVSTGIATLFLIWGTSPIGCAAAVGAAVFCILLAISAQKR